MTGFRGRVWYHTRPIFQAPVKITGGNILASISAEILDGLRAIVGADRVLTGADDLAHFGGDWTRVYTPDPSVVVLPGSIEEVQAVVRLAGREQLAIVPSGGRTGLTAVTVGILFLLAMFFSPLAGMVPAYATAGALIYVALLMMSGMQGLDYEDATELIPALLTIIMIPLSFSIANGIAVGFISYVLIKVIAGRTGDVSFGAWFLAAIFIAKFAFF